MFFINFLIETHYSRKKADLKVSSVTYYFVSLTNDLTFLCLVHYSFIGLVAGPLPNPSFYLRESFHCMTLGIGQFVLQKLKGNDPCSSPYFWKLGLRTTSNQAALCGPCHPASNGTCSFSGPGSPAFSTYFQ